MTTSYENNGLSSYELSSAQIKSLITDNTLGCHHPFNGSQDPHYFDYQRDKPPFEAAAGRMKKLQFFYQEQGKEIQETIARSVRALSL